MQSNWAGVWSSSDPDAPARDVFRGAGLRFQWQARPGPCGQPVTGYSYAIDDSSTWSAYAEILEWPPGSDLWQPSLGPHAFFVRAIDAGGGVRAIAAQLNVFAGPAECADGAIVVVLDTNAQELLQDSILPKNYTAIERDLVDSWFEGYDYEVFETSGTTPPPGSLLDCATSLFWIHSTSALNNWSVLRAFHTGAYNPLPSYVAAGGNLFLCGFGPSAAVRFFQETCGEVISIQNTPIPFYTTLTNPDYFPHWAATQLGISEVGSTVANTTGPHSAPDRLAVASSAVTGGMHPYPDLPFDPSTWPDGESLGGFGYYDRDLVPMPGAETVYKLNATERSVGLRRLAVPDGSGSTVFLGFHPYFVDRPAFHALVEAVLSDFGEALGR